MKPTERHINNRVRLAAVFVCCVLAARASAQLKIEPKLDTDSLLKKALTVLAKEGPKFLAAYVISDFAAEVFVRQAPIVVEYQLGEESTATITFTAVVKKERKTYARSLSSTGGEVRQVSFDLPPEFGKKAVVGTMIVKAENRDRAKTDPPDFELLGVCMGEKGCGSIGIDRLNFQPDRVRATQQEQVDYSFHSRGDFEKASAEFLVLERTPGGQYQNRRVKTEKLSGLRRDASVGRRWNGKDQKGRVSKGRHRLFVKAWNAEKKGGDWASAISRQRVVIE